MRLSLPSRIVLAIFLAAIGFATNHAAAANPNDAKPQRISIHPENVMLAGSRSTQGLRVTAHFEHGNPVDVTNQAKYRSSDASIAAVGIDGLVQPKANGETVITAQFGGFEVASSIKIGHIENNAYNFQNDVLPVIERLTCNQMGCHGSPKGKKRLHLSLFSADPHKDYLQIADWEKKLIDIDEPSKSWILLKATCEEDHGGGDLTSDDKPEYKLLVDWIKNGAHEGTKEDPSLLRIEVFPVERHLLPGESQRLLVEAYYSDGTMRDVTLLAGMKSNEEAVAKIDSQGLIEGTGYGEAVLMVSYGGRLTTSRITCSQPMSVTFPEIKPNNKIDEFVIAKLQSLNILTSDLCSDAEFIRRVYLDVIGILPTPAETRSFLADSSLDKRKDLIDALLARPEYADFYGVKWGDIFQINRDAPARLGDKGMWTFYRWLWDALDQNMPMDRFVREILTARGSSSRNGPANFFRVGEGPQGMAEHASTAFLGVRLDCAHCHNHPFEQFTLNDNLGMAAFFTKVKVKRTQEQDEEVIYLADTGSIKNPDTNEVASLKFLGGDEVAAAERAAVAAVEKERVAAEKVANEKKTIAQQVTSELAKDKKNAELQAKLAAANSEKAAADKVLAEKTAAVKTATSALAAKELAGDPRAKLADWIVSPQNPYFSRHMANRVWTWLLGRGIIDEPDDFRSTNPASNEELLNYLAGEFIRSGYDMKQMFRLILNSRTYQLSAEPNSYNKHDRIHYSHYRLKRLSAEQLATAISQVTGVHEKYAGVPLGTRATQLPDVSMRSEMLDLFGRPKRATPVESERTCETHIGQSLHLISSDSVASKVRDNNGRVAQLVATGKTWNEIIDELYLATLCRIPSAAERDVLFEASTVENQRREKLEDLLWVLLNTKEFLFNH